MLCPYRVAGRRLRPDATRAASDRQQGELNDAAYDAPATWRCRTRRRERREGLVGGCTCSGILVFARLLHGGLDSIGGHAQFNQRGQEHGGRRDIRIAFRLTARGGIGVHARHSARDGPTGGGGGRAPGRPSPLTPWRAGPFGAARGFRRGRCRFVFLQGEGQHLCEQRGRLRATCP